MEAEGAAPRMTLISLIEARQKFDKGEKVTFVDVRDRFAYDEAHILNATSLPMSSLEERWSALPPNHELIIYGDSPDDESVEEAAAFLKSKGLENVRIMHEGLEGWAEAGYPVGRELLPWESLELRSQFKRPPRE